MNGPATALVSILNVHQRVHLSQLAMSYTQTSLADSVGSVNFSFQKETERNSVGLWFSDSSTVLPGRCVAITRSRRYLSVNALSTSWSSVSVVRPFDCSRHILGLRQTDIHTDNSLTYVRVRNRLQQLQLRRQLILPPIL